MSGKKSRIPFTGFLLHCGIPEIPTTFGLSCSFFHGLSLHWTEQVHFNIFWTCHSWSVSNYLFMLILFPRRAPLSLNILGNSFFFFFYWISFQTSTTKTKNKYSFNKSVTGLGGLFSFQPWRGMYRHDSRTWAGLTLCHWWWHLRKSLKENPTGWLRHKGFPLMDVFGWSGVPNFICLQVCRQGALRNGKHHSDRDKVSTCARDAIVILLTLTD